MIGNRSKLHVCKYATELQIIESFEKSSPVHANALKNDLVVVCKPYVAKQVCLAAHLQHQKDGLRVHTGGCGRSALHVDFDRQIDVDSGARDETDPNVTEFGCAGLMRSAAVEAVAI